MDHDTPDARPSQRNDDDPRVALNSLSAETEAAMFLHASARAALINRLLTDPAVVAMYGRWQEATAFGRAVDNYLGWMERAASAAGIDPATLRAAIRKAMDGDGTITVEVADEARAARLTAALDEGVALLKAVDAAFDHDDQRQCVAEAIVLVRDTWRLPYPWLAYELSVAWVYALLGMTLGEVYHKTYAVELTPADRSAPAITFQFATRPGETVADAWERFRREAQAAVINPLAAAAHLPPGRRTDERIVQRYVAWWYRHRIRGESIRAIAGKDNDRRKQVRYGIRQVDRWLSVANCVWKRSDPEETPGIP